MEISNFIDVNYQIINKNLKEGKKLRIDVGTSISAPVTRHWFKNLNDIFVIGIEPNPECVEKENYWQNEFFSIKNVFKNHPQKNFYYHIIGACDDVVCLQKKNFYVTKGNVGCSSLLEPIYENLNKHGSQFDKMLEVEVFPLCELLKNLEFDFIELIKIDAQGKDLDIVKSLKQYIDKVCYIDLEDDSTYFYKNSPNQEEILSYMNNCGFKLYDTLNCNLRFMNQKIQINDKFSNLSGDM